MLDSKVQAPDHSPRASLKTSGLVRNEIVPKNTPSKQNSWPHFVFVLHKPLQPFIPRFPYQNSPNVHYLGDPKKRSFISIMFF